MQKLYLLTFNNNYYEPNHKKIIGVFDLVNLHKAFINAWENNKHDRSYSDDEFFITLAENHQVQAANDVCYQIEEFNLNEVHNLTY